MADEPLTGGNSLEAVTRRGDTVRKSATASTPAVHSFLRHLGARGIDVPSPLPSDDAAVQVLSFVPGTLAAQLPPFDATGLATVGALVRSIHDAAASFARPEDATWTTAIPAPGADLVCHNDLAPWNLIVGDGLVFIDWDASAPSTRVWDLAYATQAFCLNDPSRPPNAAAHDLEAFVEGYGASDAVRHLLADTIVARVSAMERLLRESHQTGKAPWAEMFVNGHGDHWRGVLEYVTAHRSTWHRALTGTAAS